MIPHPHFINLSAEIAVGWIPRQATAQHIRLAMFSMSAKLVVFVCFATNRPFA